jgi:hypothetical protein
MLSDPPDPLCVFESDSLAIVTFSVSEKCCCAKDTSDEGLALAVQNCALAKTKKAFAGANAFS